MLWFSIPAVILLASIPVLVIVSQIENFNMRKLRFTKAMMVFSFIVAGISAFNQYWFPTAINLVACIMWEHLDRLENVE